MGVMMKGKNISLGALWHFIEVLEGGASVKTEASGGGSEGEELPAWGERGADL